MTRSARWLLGGGALTLAALSVVWLRPAPQTGAPPPPARTERQARRLGSATAPPVTDPAPARLEVLVAPVAEDLSDAEDVAEPDPAEAKPAEPKPLAPEALPEPHAAAAAGQGGRTLSHRGMAARDRQSKHAQARHRAEGQFRKAVWNSYGDRHRVLQWRRCTLRVFDELAGNGRIWPRIGLIKQTGRLCSLQGKSSQELRIIQSVSSY